MLEFLPSNTNFKLQSEDQGIIKDAKDSGRICLISKAIKDCENGINQKCYVLEKIRLISSTWNKDVKKFTIKNVYSRCGFTKKMQNHG